MAITADWNTKTFTVPQSDLTLVSGTLYDVNTETVFRQGINAIMASEEGIVFEDPIVHNTEVTVAGTTFARTIEVVNGYSVTFTPDSQWTARLIGSNNNIFDVENGILNQNQVQVIPTNSAGLISSAAVTTQDINDISDAVWDEPTSGHQTAGTFGKALTDASTATVDAFYSKVMESGMTFEQFVRLTSSVLFGKSSGAGGGTVRFRDINDAKDRIVSVVDQVGNRSSVSLDAD